MALNKSSSASLNLALDSPSFPKIFETNQMIFTFTGAPNPKTLISQRIMQSQSTRQNPQSSGEDKAKS